LVSFIAGNLWLDWAAKGTAVSLRQERSATKIAAQLDFKMCRQGLKGLVLLRQRSLMALMSLTFSLPFREG